jgi:hypothetical protein
MAEKVERFGISRIAGCLYFVKADGVYRKPRMGRSEKIRSLSDNLVPGWLYFVDKDGDVSRSRMKRR